MRESNEEPDDFSQRINHIIELNEDRVEVHYKLKKYRSKMKSLFDRKSRERDFREGDLVLRWDARRKEKGKHENLEGEYSSFLVNGNYLKH